MLVSMDTLLGLAITIAWCAGAEVMPAWTPGHWKRWGLKPQTSMLSTSSNQIQSRLRWSVEHTAAHQLHQAHPGVARMRGSSGVNSVDKGVNAVAKGVLPPTGPQTSDTLTMMVVSRPKVLPPSSEARSTRLCGPESRSLQP